MSATVTKLAGEKELRQALLERREGNLRFPLLLMTPHGDVQVLISSIQGTREAIAWAARHYGKAAA